MTLHVSPSIWFDLRAEDIDLYAMNTTSEDDEWRRRIKRAKFWEPGIALFRHEPVDASAYHGQSLFGVDR